MFDLDTRWLNCYARGLFNAIVYVYKALVKRQSAQIIYRGLAGTFYSTAATFLPLVGLRSKDTLRAEIGYGSEVLGKNVSSYDWVCKGQAPQTLRVHHTGLAL